LGTQESGGKEAEENEFNEEKCDSEGMDDY
jgi:hypothetical protein